MIVVAAAIFSAFCLKLGLFPFHFWLPAVYVGSHPPVAAILSGALANIGSYGLLRFGGGILPRELALGAAAVMALGAASIVYGALQAVSRRDTSEVMAYSAIGQVGYILLALGIGGPVGFAAAVLYAVVNSLNKGVVFLAAGLRGPLVGAAFAVGAFSIAGVPPAAGFLGKIAVFEAAVAEGSVATGAALVALIFRAAPSPSSTRSRSTSAAFCAPRRPGEQSRARWRRAPARPRPGGALAAARALARAADLPEPGGGGRPGGGSRDDAVRRGGRGPDPRLRARAGELRPLGSPLRGGPLGGAGLRVPAVRLRGRAGRGASLLRRAVAFVPFAFAVFREIVVGTWEVTLVTLHLRPLEGPASSRFPSERGRRPGWRCGPWSRGCRPGSFFVDVDGERGVVLIHLLDASDPEAFRRQQEDFYRRYQREVFP